MYGIQFCVKGEGYFWIRVLNFLSPPIASKHSVFPLTEVSASKVPAILQKICLERSPTFDFGDRHFGTVLGRQAVFI